MSVRLRFEQTLSFAAAKISVTMTDVAVAFSATKYVCTHTKIYRIFLQKDRSFSFILCSFYIIESGLAKLPTIELERHRSDSSDVLGVEPSW